ncbi:IS4 family transposase, partial [Paludisphaera rhizosphaerae]|uniref:IS4 family transposase n=1 Tax=Paludisphaera rhizosphaerae TaxID=2711216 RepID=UPI0013ED0882
HTLEPRHAGLGDARLDRRFVKLVKDLAASPEAGIPEASGGWAAAKAAYRFFDNPGVDPSAIRDALRREALDLLPPEGPVLAVQDTTSLDFTDHEAAGGLGPLEHPARRGLLLHTTLAVSSDGVPCGLLDRRFWARDPAAPGRAARRVRPVSEKESRRWLDAAAAAEAAVPAGREVVTIADREADVYDLFARERRQGSHLLIRIKPGRGVSGPARLLRDAVRATPPCGVMAVELGRADGRPPRTAELTIRFAAVEIRPPSHRRRKVGGPPDVPLTAILVEEQSPPKDQPRVCWWLATTLPTASAADAERAARWYALRWLVERYHFVLKSGCRVERLQLRTAGRLDRALATYSAVAWRLLRLSYQARQQPDAPADSVLTPAETEILRRLAGSDSPPTLREAVRRTAKLGGFLGRKGDREPGVQTIWRGLRRLADMAAGLALA